MAYEGELVKLGNGRWARFQRCLVHDPGHAGSDQTSILVAVELDDAQQMALRSEEDAAEPAHWRRVEFGSRARPSLTTDTDHPAPTWPGDIGALH